MRLICDDKGVRFLVGFGLPGRAHEDDEVCFLTFPYLVWKIHSLVPDLTCGPYNPYLLTPHLSQVRAVVCALQLNLSLSRIMSYGMSCHPARVFTHIHM